MSSKIERLEADFTNDQLVLICLSRVKSIGLGIEHGMEWCVRGLTRVDGGVMYGNPALLQHVQQSGLASIIKT